MGEDPRHECQAHPAQATLTVRLREEVLPVAHQRDMHVIARPFRVRERLGHEVGLEPLVVGELPHRLLEQEGPVGGLERRAVVEIDLKLSR